MTGLGWDNYATDHEDANGQFEQNFQFADALTTCDRAVFFRYMVESLAQQRGLIATFMPKPFAQPDRQRLPLPRQPVVGRRERVRARPRRGSPRPRPVRARLPVHRWPEGPRQGVHRGHRADGELLQAPGRRRADERRDMGAGVRQLRLQQPHADAAHPGAGTDRGPHRRRLVQPVPGARPRCSRPDSTGSSAGSTLASPNSANLYELQRRRARGSRASSCSRPTCSTPSASSRSTTCCAPRSARSATATTSTTSRRSSAREWQAAHEQITQWELDRYLQLF